MSVCTDCPTGVSMRFQRFISKEVGSTCGFRQECHCQRLSTSVRNMIYQQQHSKESSQICQHKSNFPKEKLPD